MNAITPPAHYATPEDWARFLRPVAMAVRNTPDDEQFRARVTAVSHAVRVPAEWLRQSWRQQEAMRKFQFWPAVFDVAELFAEDLKAEAERRDRRARLAPPEPVRALSEALNTRTPEAIAHVKAVARAMAAEIAGNGPQHDKAIQPQHLSEGAMLAHYDALAHQGNRAAAARAALLRRRLDAARA